MNTTLSDYAQEKFGEFVKDKKLQEDINDIVVYRQLINIDDVVQLCLDMFMLQIDIGRLDPFDLELLKMEIRRIRSTPIDERKMTAELCDQLYGHIKMMDSWSNEDFDKRIREGRATKRWAAQLAEMA